MSENLSANNIKKIKKDYKKLMKGIKDLLRKKKK